MNEQTPNAGEKCPTCGGTGDKIGLYSILIKACGDCQGTGKKPATGTPRKYYSVEAMMQGEGTPEAVVKKFHELQLSDSPAADVKERREVDTMELRIINAIVFDTEVVLSVQEQHDIAKAVTKDLLSDLTTKLAALQVEKERLHKYSPMVESPSKDINPLEVEELAKIIQEIGSPTIAWNLVDEGWHDDRRKIAQWHLSELTTKLAALQVEKEKMLHATTAAIINFVECQTKCDQFDTDLLKSTVRNEKLNYELTTLRAENQGLVKEVERLRDVLKSIGDCQALGLCWRIADEALKPVSQSTPKEK